MATVIRQVERFELKDCVYGQPLSVFLAMIERGLDEQEMREGLRSLPYTVAAELQVNAEKIQQWRHA
jgi:hypothetical protein